MTDPPWSLEPFWSTVIAITLEAFPLLGKEITIVHNALELETCTVKANMPQAILCSLKSASQAVLMNAVAFVEWIELQASLLQKQNCPKTLARPQANDFGDSVSPTPNLRPS